MRQFYKVKRFNVYPVGTINFDTHGPVASQIERYLSNEANGDYRLHSIVALPGFTDSEGVDLNPSYLVTLAADVY